MKQSGRTIGEAAATRFRRKLDEKRRSILSGFGVKLDTSPRLDRVGEEDQAQVSHDEFVSLQLNSLDYAQLRMINEALDRLGAGDYGQCMECEEPIARARLEALPWARYCLECQEAVSRQEEDRGSEIRASST